MTAYALFLGLPTLVLVLPFYRKVDKVLTGLMPWGSRRRRVIAGTLARWYNQLTHNN